MMYQITNRIELSNFKDGAFRGRITKDTTFHDAMDMLIRSDLLTTEEKTKHITPLITYYDKMGSWKDDQASKVLEGMKIFDHMRFFGAPPSEEDEDDGEQETASNDDDAGQKQGECLALTETPYLLTLLENA